MPGLYARQGGEAIANTTTFHDQSKPSVAKLASGGFVVVWDDLSKTGADTDLTAVRGQLFDAAGRKVGDEFLVNTAVARSQTDSKVAALANGGFVVTWTDYSGEGGDSAATSVKAQMYDSAGARVGGELLVNTTTSGYQIYESVSGLSGGGFVAVWVDVQGLLSQQGNIRGQFFGADGVKLGGEFAINSLAVERQTSPKVTTLADGRFVVTWTDGTYGTLDGSGFSVRGQIFAADGARVGGEFTVNENAYGNQQAQSVTALAGGGFVAVWGDPQGRLGTWGIEAQIFDSNGRRIGGEFLVNQNSSGAQSGLSVAALPSGGFVISWTSVSNRGPLGQWSEIKAQVFGADGSRLGGEFLLNSIVTQNNQSALVALDGDRFLAVWHGGSGPDSGQYYPGDIRTQIFAPSAGVTDITVAGIGPTEVPGTVVLSETQPENIIVGTISASMQALNAAPTYAIIGDSTGGGFRLEGDRIVVADSSKINYEAAHAVTLTIRTFDGAGGHYDEIVELTLEDAAIEQRWKAGDEGLANTAASRDQMQPASAALAGGGYVMVWTDYSAQGGDPWTPTIKAQLFNADGTKAKSAATGLTTGSEFVVHWNNVEGQQYDPAVTSLSTGGFLVTWSDRQYFSETGSNLRGALFGADGARIGEQFAIQNGDAPGDQEDSAAIGLPGGGFVVVWHDTAGGAGDGNGGGIRGRIFDSAGRGGTEFVVNTTVSGEQREPAIALLADGGFIVSWTDASGADPTFITGIRAQRFDASGNKVGGEFLVNGGTAELPAPGGPEGDHTDSSVIGLAGGGFVVAWHHVRDIGLSAFRLQVFDAQGREVGREVVQDLASDARLTALRDGGFMVAFTDHRTDTAHWAGVGVRAQIFNAAGDRVGSPFLVNETLPETQVDPTITTLAGGGVAIGWIDRNVSLGDGNGTSIKTRTFAPLGDAPADQAPSGDGTAEIGTSGADVMLLNRDKADSVYGLSGNDVFFFGGHFTAADTVHGGSDFDTLGLQGDYSAGITLGSGNTSNISGIEAISLLSGRNTRFGETGENRYSYAITVIDANFSDVRVKVNGGNLLAGEDLFFDASRETDASFIIYAGLGKDVLLGGSQSDIFFFGDSYSFDAGDKVDGGAGYDGVFLRGDYDIDFNAPGFEDAFTNIESITLSSGTDERHQRGGDGEFDYRLIWADSLLAAGATMTVNGAMLMRFPYSEETMHFDGSRETDGHFRLFAGYGTDTLIGGAGNDLLYGGIGADLLVGNAGADIFRYDERGDSLPYGFDTIRGFEHGVDKIDFGRFDVDPHGEGHQRFSFIGTEAFAGKGRSSAGQLRVEQVDGALWQVQGDTNGDGEVDFLIEVHVAAGQPLTAIDFIV